MNRIVSLVSSGCVMLFALVFWIYSMQYSFHSDFGPGPATLPFWLSLILLVLSAFYMFNAFKNKDTVEAMPDREGRANIFYIIACMVMYVVLLKYIGSVLSGALFLFLLLRKEYKWYMAVAIGLMASILLFLLFSVLLEIRMPVNMFGF